MFSLRKEEKWVKTILIILSIIYLCAGIYGVLKYGERNLLGSIEKADNDDVKYIRSAWHLLDNGSFIYNRLDEPTVYIMPGLPYTLAFFMSIFGKVSAIAAFRIFQVILQCMSMYVIFFIGRKVLNSRIALGACLINLLNIPEYYTPALILTEAVFKFLLLLLIYISMYALERKRWPYYFAGGVVWALGCLFRPTIAAFPVVILIFWIIRRYSFSEMIKYTLITATVFCTVMAPWWIRNYITFNRFIPLTLSSGNPFLQGTYVNYDKTKDWTPYESSKTTIETNENEIKAGIYRLKTYGKRYPIKYIYWYTIGKSWYLWRGPFYWGEVFGIPYMPAILFHYLILFAALAGTYQAFKEKMKGFLFLGVTVAFFNVIYLPYFTFERYSYPVMALIYLFSAYGISNFSVMTHFTQRRRLNV